MTNRFIDAAWSARVLVRAGLVAPLTPDRLLGMGLSVGRYGVSSAAVYAAGTARHPNRAAIVDERGTLSYAQMDDRTSILAAGLDDLGVTDADRVGILCRNHRGFVEASVALAKLGADTLYLNTGLAPPQVAQVFERESGSAVIVDEDLLPLIAGLPATVRRILAWQDGDGRGRWPALDGMVAGDRRRPPTRWRSGRQILLTSGTTGAPKGAERGSSAGAGALLSVLSVIPFRAGDVTHIAAPMFHAWGLAHLVIGGATGATLVLRRRFDPEATLRVIQDERVTVLAVVPVMMQRIMELPDSVRVRYDTSSLRVVAASGSALAGGLAGRFMDAFGDVVYNLYGSTEVAWATIASPADLRAAPGTAGRPPRGTAVRLLGPGDDEVATGETGRIFVGNRLLFSGYTGGGSKPVVDGLMATGDVGHFDSDGRLFVDGRDDDMIVSGGENVYPGEVEDVILGHPAVVEACVVGVPDEEWGQRLRAYVVVRDGRTLTADAVKDHVRARLARYQVPGDVTFIAELPRNASGKVVRRDLAADQPPSR